MTNDSTDRKVRLKTIFVAGIILGPLIAVSSELVAIFLFSRKQLGENVEFVPYQWQFLLALTLSGAMLTCISFCGVFYLMIKHIVSNRNA